MPRSLPPLLAALACGAVVGIAVPAQAEGIGVSIGASQIGNEQTGYFRGVQFSSGLHFRTDVLSPYSEATLSILSRSQSLSADNTNVFETSGLGLAFGFKAWFLRAGLGLEAAMRRQIAIRPDVPGTLGIGFSPGFLVEPYVGVALPFLDTGVSELELGLHWPVVNWIHDSVGPRLALTLWLGGKDLEEEDEAGGTEDKGPPKEKKK